MKNIILKLIQIYKYSFSIWFGGSCRFIPTCSSYAEEAFQIYTPMKATKLVLKRLFKCHPFGPSGFDPVKKGTH